MFFKGVQVGSLYHSVCDAFDTEMGNYCLEIKIARIFKSVVGAGKGNMVLVPFTHQHFVTQVGDLIYYCNSAQIQS